MRKLLTKVRAYGWFCPYCQSHKSIDKVSVVKLTSSKYMTMMCDDCSTEVVDCFLVEHEKNCDACEDRFRCVTRADAIAEKLLKNVKSHELRILPNVIDTRNISGVRSYTGIYNNKLELNDEHCAYPERDDCNHSWMRWNYNGDSYKRCTYMRYDVENREWYCQYGRAKRV